MAEYKEIDMEHTSGPWTLSKNGNGQRIIQAPEDLGGYVIAHIGNEWTPHDGESEANARLIASTPDLLEACKSVRIRLVSTLSYVDGDAMERMQDIIDCLAETIEKAAMR